MKRTLEKLDTDLGKMDLQIAFPLQPIILKTDISSS